MKGGKLISKYFIAKYDKNIRLEIYKASQLAVNGPFRDSQMLVKIEILILFL